MNETRKTDDAQEKVTTIEGRINVLSNGQKAAKEEDARIAEQLCGDVSAGELMELTERQGTLQAQQEVMNRSLTTLRGDLGAAQAELARTEKEAARAEYGALFGEFNIELEAYRTRVREALSSLAEDSVSLFELKTRAEQAASRAGQGCSLRHLGSAESIVLEIASDASTGAAYGAARALKTA